MLVELSELLFFPVLENSSSVEMGDISSFSGECKFVGIVQPWQRGFNNSHSGGRVGCLLCWHLRHFLFFFSSRKCKHFDGPDADAAPCFLTFILNSSYFLQVWQLLRERNGFALCRLSFSALQKCARNGRRINSFSSCKGLKRWSSDVSVLIGSLGWKSHDRRFLAAVCHSGSHASDILCF